MAGGGSQSNQSTQQAQSSGSGASENQSLTLPSNLQNPAFVGNSGTTVGGLNNLVNQLSPTAFQNSNPFVAGSVTGAGGTAAGQNPLVAPVTAPQNATLSQIGSLLGQTPSTLSGAFGLLQSELNPNFASDLATSPQTAAAETAAIAPIKQQFQSQTVPGLEGSFTQAGQRVGSPTGTGSSAFSNAFANAQGNELATEAATTGAIANNAYQTGLNITANAPGQIASLTSSELNDMIAGLNAQALPQLTQQYGISAGTQLFQSQLSTILQALGLQVQGEQPAIGYGGESVGASAENSQATSSGQSSGSGSNFSLGNSFSIGL